MKALVYSIAFIIILSCTRSAWADGVFSGSWMATAIAGQMASPAQRAAVVCCRDGRELLLVQPTYRGPGAGFAWVIPVPGLPRADDIRTVTPVVLDDLLDETRPAVLSTVHWAGFTRRGADIFVHTLGGLARPGAATVTLHEVVDVGQYRAAILSATGGSVLQEWLNRNGYRTPDGADRVLGEYTGKGWYFVALKLQAPLAVDRVVTADLEPLALIFPTQRLVYPLTITRLSAAPRLALQLAVVDDQPVACAGLPMTVPERRELPRGMTYAEHVREMTGEGALLREGVSAGAYVRTFLESNAWLAEIRDWRQCSVSGFRAVLPREALRDLVFSQDSTCTPYRTVIRRDAWVPLSWWRVLALPWVSVPLLLLMWLTSVAVRRRRGTQAGHWAGWVSALAAVALVSLLVTLSGWYAARSGLKQFLLAKALQDFVAAHGCYPRNVAQLCSDDPSGMGQDGAGNPVPLNPGKPRWTMHPAPVDPLTGRPDTWVIDPTAQEFVSSRAWRVTVTIADKAALAALLRER